MLVKIFIVLLLVVILFSLGAGLIFMVRDRGGTNRTVKALSMRIALSVCLFLLLLLGYLSGVIQPHGIYG